MKSKEFDLKSKGLDLKNKVWITWERQPRNRSMADLVSAEYAEITSNSKGLSRYLYCIKETITKLKGKQTVFAQNPSIILCFLCVLCKPFFKYKLIIDAHNAGVRPKEGNNRLLQWFNINILKRANVVIVTNTKLEEYLKDFSVVTITIPDPLPKFDSVPKPLIKERTTIFIICSWAEDEPIQEYLNLAQEMPEYDFVFSGNYRKKLDENELVQLSENVKLPGFISEQEYLTLLSGCDLALDLTLRDDCLVCGAYEAISLKKKIIVSDTVVNKELFSDSVFYSNEEVSELKKNVFNAISMNNYHQIEIFISNYGRLLDERMERLQLMI